ncbi:MAG: hypothetical protein JSW57_00270 [Flavobacteriaceae bacterium]|nr:MAG: hypothetical protein JSW57_00270 [Flavobacteriaceae bacterium]
MLSSLNKKKVYKSSWKKQFTYGLIISLLIVITPLLNFIHLLIDSETNKLEILGYTLEHGYPNNQVFIWFVLSSFVSLFYLSAALLFSFGFWRKFLYPAICYFITYPVWMFADNYDNYFSFTISLYGIIFITAIIFIFKLLDDFIKQKTYKYYLDLSFKEVCQEIFLSKNSKINRQITNTLRNRKSLSLKEYSYRLYFYSTIADYSTRKGLILKSTKALQKSAKWNYFLGIIAIMLTLFLFLHHLIPNNVSELDLFGIQIGSFGFKDTGTFIYHASQKIVLSSLMIIWFTTSQLWWRWAILSPIIFYTYQFWESFQPVYAVDGLGNLNVFPLVFLTILGVLLLSKVIRRVSINLDYQAFLEEELERSIGELSRVERGA